MKAKLIKHGHSYALVLDEKLVAFAHPEDFSKNDTIGKLSLKNCEAIERGYDLDELAKTIFPDKIFTTDEEHEIPIDGSPYQWGFKVGFKKALELMGDKKFREIDMNKAFRLGHSLQTDINLKKKEYKPSGQFFEEFMQSLQQTEWDVEVEIDEEEEFIFDPAMGITQGHYLDKPKLDGAGCLILKTVGNG